MKIAVLGAGMVGRTIALDLSTNYEITSLDVSKENLNKLQKQNSFIQTLNVDLSEYRSYQQWLKPFDIVVSAVPGFMGYETLKAIINAGKNAVDISFFSENALDLNELAKEKDLTIITDCGIAPGLSNIILGKYNEEIKIDSFECYVGGLPKERKKPFEYKAPFSPRDVIQEYIRPARMMEKGKIVIKQALSEKEIIHFEEIGELEAFNTDGLRSLLFTMQHIPNMKEKTLRYPGHIDLVIALKEAGFFETKLILIKGKEISPIEFTSKILFKEWKLKPGEEEFTILHLIIKGEERSIKYFLLDRFDTKTQTTSMARTTGYTCTAVVNLLAKKIFSEKGVLPPELVGKHPACFDFVINYLKERNVIVKRSEGK